MAGEGFDAKARISVEVDAKDANALVDVLAGVEDRSGATGKAVDALERSLVSAMAAAKQTQKAFADTSGLRAQEQGIKSLISEYNSFSRAAGAQAGKGAVNQQFPLLQQRIKVEQEVEKQSTALAVAEEKKRQQVYEQSAKAQVGFYADLEKQRIAGAQRTNAQLVNIEQKSRQQELAGLRSAIQERNKVQEQSSQAQVKYAQEATRYGAQYGEEVNSNLITQRYALYDVAATWGVVSTATLGAATAATAVAVAYEKNFANVIRTTGVVGGQIQQLRQDLLDISTTSPISFEDITAIATLGGQLGIAAADIAEFSEVIAMFAATTDVTVDAAAEQIGRLAQLTGTAGTEYRNLASAIYETGVNAVATESAILSTASQIATAGDLAGFANHEIVALASAFASLNIAPERSRGSVQRIFGEITAAVNEGSSNLQEFANLSKMSVEEFSNAWKNDPQVAFSAFVNGLGEIQQAGGDTNSMLKELNIGAVRDIQALQALANNSEVYAAALRDTSSAYAEATALGEGYAIVAETVSARFQVLMQTFSAILDSIGSANFGPLGVLLDIMQGLAKAILEFTQTPVGQAVAGVGIALMALVGIFAAMRSASALATAAHYALIVANQGVANSSMSATGAVRGLVGELIRLSGASRTASVSVSGVGSTVRALATGLGRVTLVTAGITAAMYLINESVSALTRTFESAEDKASRYFGSMSGFADAIQQDTRIYEETGEAIRVIPNALNQSVDVMSVWATNSRNAAREQIGLGSATEETTDKIRTQNLVLGENVARLFAQQMIGIDEFSKTVQENEALLARAGFNMQEYINAIMSSDTGDGGLVYLQGLLTDIRDLSQGLTMTGRDLGNGIRGMGEGAAEAYKELGPVVSVLEDLMEVTKGADGLFANISFESELLNATMGALGINVENLGDGFADLDTEITDALTGILDAENAVVGMNNSLASLGASLAENGAEFSAYSVEGRANLGALDATIRAMAKDASPEQLAARIAGLMQALGQMGVNVAGDLAFLGTMVAQLGGSMGPDFFAVAQASLDATKAINQGFVPAVQKAARSSSVARKEVRTLSDYVGDLGKVFSDAFNFRYGLDQSVDSVADAYQRLIDYAESAAEAVRKSAQAIVEADARIKGLQAASTTLTYQLSVAQEYGDTLRANEIIAELAENQAKLRSEEASRAKSQKDLQKAQDATSKSLDGGTEASREQRDQMLSLVRAYQDQVIALADTGLSQQELERRTRELRNQFVAQVTQLGYNQTEVSKYAKSFDDLTLAIQQVPKNLTINANTNPAQRAVDELKAKLDRATNNGAGYNIPVSTSFSGNTNKMDAFFEMSEALRQMQRFQGLGDESSFTTWQNRYWAAQRKYNQYYAGGFTGRGGKYDPAGIVHKGEYVIPKHLVNQNTGVPYPHALDGLGALSRPTTNNYYNGGYVRGQQKNSIQVVELLPNQLNQLARMVSSNVSLDGQVIATATNQVNANLERRGTN